MTNYAKRGRISVAELLAKVIAAKQRAPNTDQLGKICGGGYSSQLLELRHAGRLKIEVYGKNYRVFELDGRRTAACPFPNVGPYRVLDKTGDHWLTIGMDFPLRAPKPVKVKPVPPPCAIKLTRRSAPRTAPSTWRLNEYQHHRKPMQNDRGLAADIRDREHEARVEVNWATLLQGRRFEDRPVKSSGRYVNLRGEVGGIGGGSSAMCLEA